MVVAELDEVQYDLEVDGVHVRRQLSRTVWEKSGWATVAVAFQEREADGGDWKPTKVAVLRFRRMHDVWKKQAAITLAVDDARALGAWISAVP